MDRRRPSSLCDKGIRVSFPLRQVVVPSRERCRWRRWLIRRHREFDRLRRSATVLQTTCRRRRQRSKVPEAVRGRAALFFSLFSNLLVNGELNLVVSLTRAKRASNERRQERGPTERNHAHKPAMGSLCQEHATIGVRGHVELTTVIFINRGNRAVANWLRRLLENSRTVYAIGCLNNLQAHRRLCLIAHSGEHFKNAPADCVR